jgi:hypothetical protein
MSLPSLSVSIPWHLFYFTAVAEHLALIKFKGSIAATSGTEKKKMAGIFLRL